MHFLELARRRVSVRGFKPDPVPEPLLTQILEAARAAPSACNRQPWHLIVVRSPEQRKALAAAYPRDWFAQAPVQIAVCVESAAAWRRADGRIYSDVDAAIVADHLILAAADAGLGACWIAAFDSAVARRALSLPEGVEPVILTPLGYPADAGRPKQRKALNEIVRYERW